MPAIKQTMNTSGLALWNAHEHKKGELLGLTIDNQHTAEEQVKLYDCFTTDASTAQAGTTQAAENLGTTHPLSGKVRLQLTVPTGESVSLGQEDLKGTEFLGAGYVVGSVETSDCIVIARYQLK